MAHEKETFLIEGIGRYAEARATLDYFEEELPGRLARVLEKERTWGRFDHTDCEVYDIEFKSESGWGYWAAASLDGRIDGDPKRKCGLVIGIWWGAPKKSVPIQIYGSAWYKKPDQELGAKDYRVKNSAIRVADLGSGTYLLSPFDSKKSFNDMFEPIIAEIVKALEHAAGS